MKTEEKKDKRELMDDLIYEHLHRFSENNPFRASLDHFRETGKPSGSFRDALHALLEEYGQLERKEGYIAGLMVERI